MPKRHPRTRFRQATLAATKWCETTQNMSFRPNVVDWMRFGGKSRKKIRWPELVPKRHPRTRFRNGALAATKWCETTQNMSLGPKVVDWIHFGRKNKNSFIGPNSCPNGILGPDFRNGALSATKWCETTQNVSFGP